jgi:DNA-directed RNA polymerase alpha subunit
VRQEQALANSSVNFARVQLFSGEERFTVSMIGSALWTVRQARVSGADVLAEARNPLPRTPAVGEGTRILMDIRLLEVADGGMKSSVVVSEGTVQVPSDLDLPVRVKDWQGELCIGIVFEPGPSDAQQLHFDNVTFDVEPTRVEQSTNFDRLVLDIETDGSITPRESLASAGDTLRSLVSLVADMSDNPMGLELGEVAGPSTGSPDLDLPIEDLDLSERPRNCLKRAQVNTIGELLEKTEDDLLAITNFGQKSLDEVIQKLDERGLSLRRKGE